MFISTSVGKVVVRVVVVSFLLITQWFWELFIFVTVRSSGTSTHNISFFYLKRKEKAFLLESPPPVILHKPVIAVSLRGGDVYRKKILPIMEPEGALHLWKLEMFFKMTILPQFTSPSLDIMIVLSVCPSRFVLNLR